MKVDKIALSRDDNKRTQTLDCRKAIGYVTSNEVRDENERINKRKTLQKYK